MNEPITYKLEGTKEVLEALTKVLPDKEIIKLVRQIEVKALNEKLVKPIRSAVPHTSLKRAIGIAKNKFNNMAYDAGVIIGKRRDKNTPPAGVILTWLEKGTKERKGRGKITANPIVTPLIEASAEPIVEYFQQDFEKAVEDRLSKIIKKGQK